MKLKEELTVKNLFEVTRQKLTETKMLQALADVVNELKGNILELQARTFKIERLLDKLETDFRKTEMEKSAISLSDEIRKVLEAPIKKIKTIKSK